MWTYIHSDELYHYGVKGMKWGKRKSYRSRGIRAAIAKRANDKVDEGFKAWQDNSEKRDRAIDLGKKANQARLAYENNRSDAELKTAYKQANKDYKSALRENTTYRKGVVKQEVGRDAARKYLSEAKKVKKELDKNPSDKTLKKQYADLMSKHDVERADARRAVEVANNRSKKKAAIKRGMTMTAKAAAVSVTAAAGAYAVNRYLSSHNVTLNGRPMSIGQKNINDVIDLVKKGSELLKYV